jgi:nitroreductase
MELLDALRLHRLEPGPFLDQAITPAHWRLLIESAARSPSHFNSQPWRFIIIEDEAVRRAISGAPDAAPLDPALLAITLNRGEYKPGELQGLYSTITLGAVVQALSLVAASIGIGLRFVPVEQRHSAISGALRVPDNQFLAILFGIGYRAEPAAPGQDAMPTGAPVPPPLSTLVALDSWGAPLPEALIGQQSVLWPGADPGTR